MERLSTSIPLDIPVFLVDKIVICRRAYSRFVVSTSFCQRIYSQNLLTMSSIR
jgi:hypothetical protein